MYTTKFDGNDLTIIIEEPVQKQLINKGINPVEVFRLIESFASKILASKKDESIEMSNEDTGASLALDVKWESETKASVQVSLVNFDELKIETKPISKVNLGEALPQ